MPRPPRGRTLPVRGDADTVQAQTVAEQEAFGQVLDATLAEQGDIASAETWEALARLIARTWLTFRVEQSPLSTFRMLTECGNMKLKCRLAAKKGGGGEQEQRELEELQRWFDELKAPEETLVVPGGEESEADEEDEDE